MVARQFLRTFMAASATAVGVRTSSHAGDGRKKRDKNVISKNNKKCEPDRKGFNGGEETPTFTAAGHGALERARDGLSRFLLSWSLLQRHSAD